MSTTDLTRPQTLYTCEQALADDGAPRRTGVYGWWFHGLEDRVPIEGCETAEGGVLLYVGIAPRKPPRGNRSSHQTLRTRLRTDIRGNAATSSLRLSVGSLLADDLGLRLHRTGSTERLTYGDEGEERLSRWLGRHARLSWLVTPRPWELEPELLRDLSLPLNIQGNDHPFAADLSRLRAVQRWGAA